MVHRFKLFLNVFNAFSLVVWAWLVLEFFSQGRYHLPAAFSALYLTLVGFYVGDNELLRMRKRFSSRSLRGELFVLLWLLTLIAAGLIVSFGGVQRGYSMPPDLPVITGTVLIFWLITEYLKSRGRKRRS